MPRYASCQIRWSSQTQKYELSVDDFVCADVLTADWLDAIDSFSFHSRSGVHYTVRKQKGVYWYGYRRLQGRVIKRYLGKTAALSLARLEELAHSLMDEASRPTEHGESNEALPPSSREPRYAEHEDAIETALFADDVERAALLIERAGTGNEHWGSQMRLHWLEQIPEKVLQAHPALCLNYAAALRFPSGGMKEPPLPGAIKQRIEVLLQMAEETWSERGKLTEIGGIYAFRVWSALGQEPLHRLAGYAERALSLLPENSSELQIQAGRGICLSCVGIKNIREGHFNEAQRCFLAAHACSLITGDRHFIQRMVLALGGVSFVLGELHLAAEYYRQALVVAREQEDSQNVAQALSGLIWLSLAWNKLTAAEQQAQDAFIVLGDNEQEMSDRVTFQTALLQHAQGQTTLAQRGLSALLARLQISSTPWALWLLPDVLIWQVRLHLATDNPQAAQHGLEVLTFHKDELDFVQNMSMQILIARLKLAQGEINAARIELERLLPIVQERWMMHDVLEIQVLLALVYISSEQKREAHWWLTRALSQARSEGFLHIFLREGEALSHLLRSLLPTLQEKELYSYAQTILYAFTISNDEEDSQSISTSQSLLIEPLSPQERRVLWLLTTGRTNPQIAQALVISVNTVKHHLKQLYRKLGVSNRLEASETARRLKLL